MAVIFYKWLMCASLFLTPVNLNKHPIYVSVTEIGFNTKEKTLEISCKTFTDDIEKALRKNYAAHVELAAPKDKPAMEKLLNDYLQKHLKIAVDGKSLPLQFIGYEQVDEGIITYYQANNISAVKNISVTDNVLYDYQKDQVSVLHITVNGKRQSTKVNNPEDKVSFDF